MAEQSVRHVLMVVALMQCASETLNDGGDASEAATRCIEMFRRLFPGATRDELRSAIVDAEKRRSEVNALLCVDSAPDLRVKPQTIQSVIDGAAQRAAAETAISVRAPGTRPISKLAAAWRSGLVRFIPRQANRCGGLVPDVFQIDGAEEFFEMLIFPPIALLHVGFALYWTVAELIASGRLRFKPVLMRLPAPAMFVRLSGQHVKAHASVY